MSHHQKVWGTEHFLLGLALFLLLFISLWASIVYMNDDFLPVVK